MEKQSPALLSDQRVRDGKGCTAPWTAASLLLEADAKKLPEEEGKCKSMCHFNRNIPTEHSSSYLGLSDPWKSGKAVTAFHQAPAEPGLCTAEGPAIVSSLLLNIYTLALNLAPWFPSPQGSWRLEVLRRGLAGPMLARSMINTAAGGEGHKGKCWEEQSSVERSGLRWWGAAG